MAGKGRRVKNRTRNIKKSKRKNDRDGKREMKGDRRKAKIRRQRKIQV